MNGIGERIKAIRKSKLMSVPELATKSKVDISTICKIEAGESKKPREKTLAKLAAAFDMKPEEFSKAIHYVDQKDSAEAQS